MQSTNTKESNQYMSNAIKYAMEQYPIIPLYNFTYFRLVNPYVGGYNPTNNHMDVVYSKWLYFKHGQS